MDTQEKPKKKLYKKWWFWAGIALVAFIVIGASGGSKTSVPAPADGTVSASQPQKAETSQQTLLDLKGSGSKSTQKFTAAGDWDLAWSYDCSNFAGQGNFQVFIYDGNGNMSLRNSPINQLGASDTGVEHYHSGGTYYLTVNSECSWKVQVKG